MIVPWRGATRRMGPPLLRMPPWLPLTELLYSKNRPQLEGPEDRQQRRFQYSGKLTWLAGKWTRNEDVFPIEHGDIPASYVSLPEGNTVAY